MPNANFINHTAKPHWITPRKGGQGAVRDVCDLICIAKKVLNKFLKNHNLKGYLSFTILTGLSYNS